jgi:hypothetical protein
MPALQTTEAARLVPNLAFLYGQVKTPAAAVAIKRQKNASPGQ